MMKSSWKNVSVMCIQGIIPFKSLIYHKTSKSYMSMFHLLKNHSKSYMSAEEYVDLCTKMCSLLENTVQRKTCSC